ncbi:hypothetical protein HID58_087672 [Brassica napus]|uniref:BnaC09g30390D protein n=2 Tax=Brassica napus TaxID=3708 RepID=A0A078G0W4_BRANA|nr:hypothetical protein HID58_087672 [Brassica napus]CAF1758411.1 unnamed protein product [Brassica napus]CDY20200.1 BnaC09g30390D [Brassica napus]
MKFRYAYSLLINHNSVQPIHLPTLISQLNLSPPQNQNHPLHPKSPSAAPPPPTRTQPSSRPAPTPSTTRPGPDHPTYTPFPLSSALTPPILLPLSSASCSSAPYDSNPPPYPSIPPPHSPQFSPFRVTALLLPTMLTRLV